MPRDYVERILKARVYDVARESSLDPAPRLSRRLDNNVLLKREDLQPVFSFKVRGAYNKIYNLTPAERARGVIASSAGNHAQGELFHLGQGVDEIVRRASGPHPDDGTCLHEFQRGPRHGLLLFVLRHRMLLAWCAVCTDTLVRPSNRTLLYTACPALRAIRPE